MVVRVALGAAWALVVGMAGGWLMLSPWALGQQPSGKDWTSVTQTEFFTGLGLLLLAVIGMGMVAAQSIAVLRETGRSAQGNTGAPRSADRPQQVPSPDLETTLVGLAQALTKELQSEPGSSAGTGPRRDLATTSPNADSTHEVPRPDYPPAFRRPEG